MVTMKAALSIALFINLFCHSVIAIPKNEENGFTQQIITSEELVNDPKTNNSFSLLSLLSQRKIQKKSRYLLSYKIPSGEVNQQLKFYWMAFTLRGHCKASIPNSASLHQSLLQFLNIFIETEIRINMFKCADKNLLYFNVSVPSETFVENEFEWQKLFKKGMLLSFMDNDYRMVNFDTIKSTILKLKNISSDKEALNSFLTWFSICASLGLFCLFTSAFVIRICHQVCKRSRNSEFDTHIFMAYDESSAQAYVKQNSSKSSNHLTESPCQMEYEDMFDNNEELLNDLTEFSSFQPEKKVKFVKENNNLDIHFGETKKKTRGSKKLDSLEGSSTSEGEFVDSRNINYIGNPVYSLVPKSTMNSRSTPMSSIESLCLTRIKFVDGDSPAFRIETDF